MSESGGVVLITGASAGIGYEFARVFAEHGHNLVIVARRKEKLDDLADELRREHSVHVHVIALDLSERSAPQTLFDAVTTQDLNVEVLVNNAGLALFEPFRQSAPEDIEALINLNVSTTTRLTHLFLQPMLQRRAGRILNVSSLAAFFPAPTFAAYAASKAYILSLSEALAIELHGTGVTVTALCPGYTKTHMITRAFEGFGYAGKEHWTPSIIKLDPKTVARRGYKACMSGKALKIDSLLNALSVQLIRYQPKWLLRILVGLVSRLARP